MPSSKVVGPAEVLVQWLCRCGADAVVQGCKRWCKGSARLCRECEEVMVQSSEVLHWL